MTSKEKEAVASKDKETTENKGRQEQAPEKTMVHDGLFVMKEEMMKLMSDFENFKVKAKGERPEYSRRPKRKVCNDKGDIQPPLLLQKTKMVMNPALIHLRVRVSPQS